MRLQILPKPFSYSFITVVKNTRMQLTVEHVDS